MKFYVTNHSKWSHQRIPWVLGETTRLDYAQGSTSAARCWPSLFLLNAAPSAPVPPTTTSCPVACCCLPACWETQPELTALPAFLRWRPARSSRLVASWPSWWPASISSSAHSLSFPTHSGWSAAEVLEVTTVRFASQQSIQSRKVYWQTWDLSGPVGPAFL